MAVFCAGTANPNSEYIDGGNPSVLDFGSADFTIMCWVMSDATGEANPFGIGSNEAGGIRYNLFIDIGNIFRFVMDDNVTKEEANTGVDVVDGSWYHLVGVRDGTLMRTYINGVANATNPVLAGYSVIPNGPLRIGNIEIFGTANSNQILTGNVDDCRIYGGALSAARILNIYSARGHDVDVEDLRARFQLDEGAPGALISGAEVKDSSPTGIITTANNSPEWSDSELTYKRRCVG